MGGRKSQHRTARLAALVLVFAAEDPVSTRGKPDRGPSGQVPVHRSTARRAAFQLGCRPVDSVQGLALFALVVASKGAENQLQRFRAACWDRGARGSASQQHIAALCLQINKKTNNQ